MPYLKLIAYHGQSVVGALPHHKHIINGILFRDASNVFTYLIARCLFVAKLAQLNVE